MRYAGAVIHGWTVFAYQVKAQDLDSDQVGEKGRK
jgi:hypothetical protein